MPVLLAPPRAGSPPDFVGRALVIEVHVASDPDWSASLGVPPVHNGRRYLAMIDTGADSTAIDVSVAAAIKATSARKGNVHGWVGSDNNVEIVNIQLFIPPPANVTFAPEAAVRNFRRDGQTWDLILGRSFLQYCRLLVDGPRSEYSLEWIGPAG